MIQVVIGIWLEKRVGAAPFGAAKRAAVKPKLGLPPVVACADCAAWHRQGLHVVRRVDRAVNRKIVCSLK